MTLTIPVAATTGTFFPTSTVESIQILQSIGVKDIELTLQSHEFYLDLERRFCMPPLPFLIEQVWDGGLRVRSLHAAQVGRDQSYSLKARLAYIAHAVDICDQLGGSQVVVHPSHLFHSHESACEFLAGEIPLHRALLPGIEELISSADSAGVTLALENIQIWSDEVYFSDPRHMRRFLDDAAHPAVSVTLDLMHAAYAGAVGGFLALVPDAITNVHVADWLPPVKRLPPGQGVLDWPRLLPVLVRLPNLRQLTVELTNPTMDELKEALEFCDDAKSSGNVSPSQDMEVR